MIDIKSILEKHGKWLRGEDGGERAILDGRKLDNCDLRGVNLNGASLKGAYLDGAYLDGAYLNGASLKGASLKGAYLDGASLKGASLDGAYLDGASLDGAYLDGTKIEEPIKIKFFPLACPETGAFIGYKKAAQNLVVKLQIPEDAKRSSAYGRKCRCDKAIVLGIYDMDGNKTEIKQVTSKRNEDFVYEVGQTVSVPDFDEYRWNECSTGIHFFVTFAEAANYI